MKLLLLLSLGLCYHIPQAKNETQPAVPTPVQPENSSETTTVPKVVETPVAPKPNIIQKVAERLADKMFGSLPKSVQHFLEEHGDKPISNLTLHRAPILEAVQGLIEAADRNLKPKFDKFGYDNFYHTWLTFNVDGRTYGIEKNFILRIYEGVGRESATLPISTKGKTITIRSLIMNAIKEKGEDRVLKYDMLYANCQDFLTDLLSVAGILPPDAEAFFNQNAKSLIDKRLKHIVNIGLNFGTTIGGYVNRAIQHVSDGKIVPLY